MNTDKEPENRTDGVEDKKESQSVTNNEVSMPGNVSARPGAENKGSQPSADIANGGSGGAKQPREHTGHNTEMGGATGGETDLPDASDENDNTKSATGPDQ